MAEIELNFGQLAHIVGTYYRDGEEAEYSEAVEALDEWLQREKEKAHLEAMDGVVGAIFAREEFEAKMGVLSEEEQRGIRSARRLAQEHRDALDSLYQSKEARRGL